MEHETDFLGEHAQGGYERRPLRRWYGGERFTVQPQRCGAQQAGECSAALRQADIDRTLEFGMDRGEEQAMLGQALDQPAHLGLVEIADLAYSFARSAPECLDNTNELALGRIETELSPVVQPLHSSGQLCQSVKPRKNERSRTVRVTASSPHLNTP